MAKKVPRGFLALAKARKTVYEFSEKKVKPVDLEKILEVARWAPSTNNVQPWHFIVVENKETIERLLKECYYGGFHTPPPPFSCRSS